VLEQISHPKLAELLALTDVTPNDLSESGAEDWADLGERMHFITDFFRGYQERQELSEPPFTPEQAIVLKSGRLPYGSL
jgi:hypothetical protein